VTGWPGHPARNLSTEGCGEERCCKSELESGAIPGRAAADRRPSGAAQMELDSSYAQEANRVYNLRVFEVKKEIRASTRDRSFRELDIS
jgi:hypothetical protein